MKKLAIMLLLIATVYGQNKVPNIRLKMLDGKYAKLYDLLKEGPILVDFWATWCEPCKKEMYFLNKFHNQLEDTGFKVLTINTDTPRSIGKVKSYIKSKKYEFLVAVDPNQQVMKKMSVKLLPTTILVDNDGTILFRHQGYSPGDEKIILKHTKFVTGTRISELLYINDSAVFFVERGETTYNPCLKTDLTYVRDSMYICDNCDPDITKMSPDDQAVISELAVRVDTISGYSLKMLESEIDQINHGK